MSDGQQHYDDAGHQPEATHDQPFDAREPVAQRRKIDRRILIGAPLAAVALVAIGLVMTSKPDRAFAAPIDITMQQADNLADRIGVQAGLGLAEHCSLPVEMGAGRSTVAMVKQHLAIDPNFTNLVEVRVIVQPGDRFIIDERGRVTCPSRADQ